MNQPDLIITVIVGVINFFALAFVGWQTFLTRKSLALMQTTSKEAQRARELTQLPDSNWIIHVIIYLDRWREELKKIVCDEQIIKSRILAGDKKIGEEYGLGTPKGLIRQDVYDRLPQWLQYILMAAAQYYFDGKSFAYVLSDTESNIALSMLPETIDRCRTGIRRIDEMKSYIEYIVPEWYLNSPASVDDHKFFQ